jgi:hypothetical protein
VSRWPVSLAFFTLRPSWRAREISFEARTPLVLRMLSLFAYERRLRIDINRRIVLLQTRQYWLSSATRVIPFERIKSIVYGYSYIPMEDDDTLDVFRVGLLLDGEPNPLTLFEFRGDAGIAADFALEMTDDLDLNIPIDFHTDEESMSEAFVQLLRRYLGKPVRSAMHTRVVEVMRKDLHPCPKCSRQILRSAEKCVYCGTRFT